MPRKIYVASSWRNERQQTVVVNLRRHGQKVYDFRNPGKGDRGFHWSEIDPNWTKWSPSQFRNGLSHTIAVEGFGTDYAAMNWADTFLLVMPCGRSAHLELGWAIGQGKKTAILLSTGEPELMYKLVDELLCNQDELTKWALRI